MKAKPEASARELKREEGSSSEKYRHLNEEGETGRICSRAEGESLIRNNAIEEQ